MLGMQFLFCASECSGIIEFSRIIEGPQHLVFPLGFTTLKDFRGVSMSEICKVLLQYFFPSSFPFPSLRRMSYSLFCSYCFTFYN